MMDIMFSSSLNFLGEVFIPTVLLEVRGADELRCASGRDVSKVWSSAFKLLRADYIPVTVLSTF